MQGQIPSARKHTRIRVGESTFPSILTFVFYLGKSGKGITLGPTDSVEERKPLGQKKKVSFWAQLFPPFGLCDLGPSGTFVFSS